MMPFAPTPIPDEIFLSYVLRWYKRSGFRCIDSFLAAAFPRSDGRPFGFVKDNDASLIVESVAGTLLNSDQIREQHTLIPFFRRIDSHRRLGRPRQKASPFAERFQYCISCMEDPKNDSGASAFLRAHNLPSVAACHIHGTQLHWADAFELDLTPKEFEVPASQELIWMATEAYELLVYPDLTPLACIREAIWRGIKRRFGVSMFKTYWGWNEQKFAAELMKTFSIDFLKQQNWTPDPSSSVAIPLPGKSDIFYNLHPNTLIITAAATHGGVHDLLIEATSIAASGANPIGPVEEWRQWTKRQKLHKVHGTAQDLKSIKYGEGYGRNDHSRAQRSMNSVNERRLNASRRKEQRIHAAVRNIRTIAKVVFSKASHANPDALINQEKILREDCPTNSSSSYSSHVFE